MRFPVLFSRAGNILFSECGVQIKGIRLSRMQERLEMDQELLVRSRNGGGGRRETMEFFVEP
jgi:hypothetical protein